MKQGAIRWFDAGVFGIFFVLFLHAIEDPDIWYHMTIGRAVLEQGSVPAQEFYIFTRLGQPAEFHEWGFGLLYYLIHEAAGLTGMILANALFGALSLYLLYHIICRRGLSVAAALTATAVGFWLMEFRFVLRPENLLYLALAATLFFTEKYRTSGTWRWLVPVPLIGLILTQVHPSVIMLGLVLGTYLTEALVRSKPDLTQAAQLALTIVSTLAVSIINPYGIEQLILPIKFAMETALLDSITEFLPALSTELAYRFVIGITLILFSLIGIKKRFSLAEWLILIAFAFLAYQHARNIALLGLALVLPLATALDIVLKKRAYSITIAAAFLLLVAIDALRLHRLSFDIESQVATIKGAEIVAQTSTKGNILNFYHLGNYLAWRLGDTHKVLIDGRNFRNNAALTLHDALLLATPGWQNFLDRYSIVAIVIPATLPYSGDFVPLAFELPQTPGWRLASREPAGLVFLRDSEANGQDCVPIREIWVQAKEELMANLSNNPDSISSQHTLKTVTNKLDALNNATCRTPDV
jgi:hypothetical protein